MRIESFGRLATAIFIFLLIISGNYLGNLFPCRIQELFEKSIWFKHFLGYFSLVFFVLITMPLDVKDVEINENNEDENNENNEDSNFQTLLISSFLLYIFFLILSNTPSNVWLIVFITCSIIYLLELKKEDYKNKNNHSITNINQIQYILGCFILLTTFFGFLVYMGEKKIEYKKKFNYITFIFAATECKGYTYKKNTISSIKHVFD